MYLRGLEDFLYFFLPWVTFSPGLKVFSPGNLVPVEKTGTKGPSQPRLKGELLVPVGVFNRD